MFFVRLLEGFCSWPWELYSHHVPHRGGFPSPVGEWALHPAAPGEGFVSGVKVLSQFIPRPYSLMCYLLTRWGLGQWRREEAGEGKGLLGLCWQYGGGALSQLLFPAPSQSSQVRLPGPSRLFSQSVQHWPPFPEQGTALPVCPRLSLFRCGLRTLETRCPMSPQCLLDGEAQLAVAIPGVRKEGVSPALASVAVCVSPVLLSSRGLPA